MFFSQKLTALKGVGIAISKNFHKLLGGDKISDLLLCAPRAVEKISICPRLFEVQNDELIIVKAKIDSHIKPKTNRQPYKILCYTPSGFFYLVFFKIFPSQIAKLSIGSEVAILGRLQKIMGEMQITHPQEIVAAKDINLLPTTNVVYPLVAGISQKFLRQKIKEVLSKLDANFSEWLDINLIKQHKFPSFTKALYDFHHPHPITDLINNIARQRLAYDELLAWQIAVLMAKNKSRKNKILSQKTEDFGANFLKQLPFQPTTAQQKAMLEIGKEINSSKQMLRLLQGDVGSGKTIIAIFSCLEVLAKKQQACVLVPTTVLAKQHFSYFERLLKNFNFNIAILTSATTKAQKNKILQNLKNGTINILISTHAALEDNVEFANLGLAIIDEQHRFGVVQRLKIVEKGTNVDLLLMSATPIPRSLMMALYGDMDISILDEKPKNRQKIETLVMSEEKSDDIHQAISRAIAKGNKIYWICPAIEVQTLDDLENQNTTNTNNINSSNNLQALGEVSDLVAAKKKHEELCKIFGENSVGLLHGKMKESEKEKIMNEFAKPDGSLKILVATTVIEVGIDVSDATIIVIENSEHFGLSQLHQLRGRVGRSDKKSFCILLYGKKIGSNGRKRLEVLRQSDDGFFIAEEDLKMRGSGDLLGTKQSGFPEFRIANLVFDSNLLKIANKNAQVITNQDSDLQKPENQKYCQLLEFFSYDEFLKLVHGG